MLKVRCLLNLKLRVQHLLQKQKKLQSLRQSLKPHSQLLHKQQLNQQLQPAAKWLMFKYLTLV